MAFAVATTSYPLFDIFWTLLEFFLWGVWIGILIMVFIDIFRSHDLSGGAKALRFPVVLFIPLVGVCGSPSARRDRLPDRPRRRDARAGRAAGDGAGPSRPRVCAAACRGWLVG